MKLLYPLLPKTGHELEVTDQVMLNGLHEILVIEIYKGFDNKLEQY